MGRKTPIWIPSAAFEPVETSFPSLESIDGTNLNLLVRGFDRATVEYVNTTLKLPTELDTSGSVIFTLPWYARVVPGSSLNVLWGIEEKPIAAGESWDAALTDHQFAVSASGTLQNGLVIPALTVSIATLGWAADDVVMLRLRRVSGDASDTLDDAATSTDDDAMLLGMGIVIPVI